MKRLGAVVLAGLLGACSSAAPAPASYTPQVKSPAPASSVADEPKPAAVASAPAAAASASKPAPPTTAMRKDIAGFFFGMSMTQASDACVRGGGRPKFTSDGMMCSQSPVDLGFDAFVVMRTCAEAVCILAMFPKGPLLRGHVDPKWLAQVFGQLVERYGPPQIDSSTTSIEALAEACEAGSVKVDYAWVWSADDGFAEPGVLDLVVECAPGAGAKNSFMIRYANAAGSQRLLGD